MPLEPPVLDARTFDDLYEEARRRIPRYTREWTDFNESDPGITLLQLFCWLSELMLHQLNRVPERNYIKFLQLLGMELEPARPATADLTFTPSPGAAVEPVPERTQVMAAPPGGGDPLVFETTRGLDLVAAELAEVRFSEEPAAGFHRAANSAEAAFPPFGWTPQPGSALYLGFASPPLPPPARVFPDRVQLRVFLPPVQQAGAPARCRGDAPLPRSPAELAWEYKPTQSSVNWRRLALFEDETAGFTREGYLSIQGPPATIEPSAAAGVEEPRYWLRCRLVSGGYPAGRAPEVQFIRANTVPAENLTTVLEEPLGGSDGRVDQVVALRFRPVQPDSLELVTRTAGEEEPWRRVDDLLASDADAPHYLLNPTRGEVRFGDGEHGRVPVAGAEIVALRYRYGGGAAGNLAPGLITTPLAGLVGVDAVTNERPAVGGRDEEETAALAERAPGRLRTRGRAVTNQDFAVLAAEAGRVARATAIPLAHPDHPGVEVPGTVTVVIVPDSEEMPPAPSPDLIRSVCEHLEQYRLITTEVFVRGPEYLAVTVRARVEIQPYKAFGQVIGQVRAALVRYLSPLNGWGFGQDLHPNSLYAVILGVDGVVTVPGLELLVDNQPHPLDKRVRVPAWGLLFATDPDIKPVPYRDE